MNRRKSQAIQSVIALTSGPGRMNDIRSEWKIVQGKRVGSVSMGISSVLAGSYLLFSDEPCGTSSTWLGLSHTSFSLSLLFSSPFLCPSIPPPLFQVLLYPSLLLSFPPSIPSSLLNLFIHHPLPSLQGPSLHSSISPSIHLSLHLSVSGSPFVYPFIHPSSLPPSFPYVPATIVGIMNTTVNRQNYLQSLEFTFY